MAKKAVINRDLRRRVTVKKYAKKRAELQASIDEQAAQLAATAKILGLKPKF